MFKKIKDKFKAMIDYIKRIFHKDQVKVADAAQDVKEAADKVAS